jgi:ABC-2 type transport system ATP-binding protein
MSNEAIRLEGLTKQYRVPGQKAPRVAVDALSLDVPAGGLFGFLGPNGAGKTSTIKMVLGFIKPTAGAAWIFDRPVQDDAARKRVGYLPEQPYFPKFLTATEVVAAHANFAGLSGRKAKERVTECLAMVGMNESMRMPLSKCSKGMVQRIGLATALVGNPDLLILDEPSSGLDPLGRKELRELLAQLKAEGKTIFVSSHLLTEMEPLCDKVGVLARGTLVAAGSPAEITRSSDEVEVRIETPSGCGPVLQELAGIGEGLEVRSAEREATVVAPSALVYRVLGLIEKQRARLVSVRERRETLEDAFLRLVG